MYLPYPLIALLQLSSSTFIATWYSSQTFLAPTCGPECRRIRRTSPPKYGAHYRIWITRSTPFHSHCGSFFLPLLPYLPDLVIRTSLLVLHAQPADKNFVHTEPTTLQVFVSKGHAFFIALRWPCIYLALAFVWKGHVCFILPCHGPVYILHLWWCTFQICSCSNLFLIYLFIVALTFSPYSLVEG